VFDLASLPVIGGTAGLVAAASSVCPELGIYLPRNCSHDDVGGCQCVANHPLSSERLHGCVAQIRALMQPCHSHVIIEAVSDNGKVVAIMAYFTSKRNVARSHVKFDE
jgi:hypothetical protein